MKALLVMRRYRDEEVPGRGEEKARLDQFEKGYHTIAVTVEALTGPVPAVTYVADDAYVDDELIPSTWYRDLVLAGAASRGFPDAYLAALSRVETRSDPDSHRARANRPV